MRSSHLHDPFDALLERWEPLRQSVTLSVKRGDPDTTHHFYLREVLRRDRARHRDDARLEARGGARSCRSR